MMKREVEIRCEAMTLRRKRCKAKASFVLGAGKPKGWDAIGTMSGAKRIACPKHAARYFQFVPYE